MTPGVSKVNAHRAFVAGDARPPQRVTLDQGSPPSHRVALPGSLDFDDVSSEVSKDLSGKGARDEAPQFQDSDPVERAQGLASFAPVSHHTRCIPGSRTDRRPSIQPPGATHHLQTEAGVQDQVGQPSGRAIDSPEPRSRAYRVSRVTLLSSEPIRIRGRSGRRWCPGPGSPGAHKADWLRPGPGWRSDRRCAPRLLRPSPTRPG